ncbi:MAG: tRNA pseudouridine(38-40) synthase TruA [Acidobacteria bacterium]|nr:tRNA pseudouridine(38-40) synthase TruA [Acidobacteriota bacterium]
MRTLKLALAYDGTDFAGWQRQAGDRTVQALVEEALSRIDGKSVSVAGAGRTDAGVHAIGQVASVSVTNDLDPATLRRAVNASLPEDVRVVSVVVTHDGFDARRDARRKTYEYRILNGAMADPFIRRFAWHVPQPLNAAAMAHAAARLLGEHDFASFQSTGSSVVTTRRTIFESSLERLSLRSVNAASTAIPLSSVAGVPPELLSYRITGDGFLRHMVRAIVGTLVEIGRGRREAASIDALLAAGDRSRAGPTAPAHGLCLVNVEYEADATR